MLTWPPDSQGNPCSPTAHFTGVKGSVANTNQKIHMKVLWSPCLDGHIKGTVTLVQPALGLQNTIWAEKSAPITVDFEALSLFYGPDV